jgi:hypothetical protein
LNLNKAWVNSWPASRFHLSWRLVAAHFLEVFATGQLVAAASALPTETPSGTSPRVIGETLRETAGMFFGATC